MKKHLLVLIMSLPLLAFAEGDINKGKEKSTTCAACHGETGVSNNSIWPNLSGQHASYILKQLLDYKKGQERNNASMNSMVLSLSKQDMQDLASYYASFPIAKGATPKKYLSRGEQIYRGGDFKKHITACIACHGPKGKGNAQANFPVLSGQHAQYTIDQMNQFKTNKRRNDLNHIMRDIASNMSQEDIEAVAYYVQGLH